MFSLPQSCSPGPGAYTLKSKLFNNSPSISMMSRHSKVQSQTSEANFITPKSTLADKKISFGQRTTVKQIDESPGPCGYNPTSPTHNKGMGITLKSRTKSSFDQQKGSDVPFYDMPSFANSSKAIYFKGRPKQSLLEQSPGPTEYSVPSQFTTNKGVSMAGRTYTSRTDNFVPGPGQYELKSTLSKQGGKIFTQVQNRGGICLDTFK